MIQWKVPGSIGNKKTGYLSVTAGWKKSMGTSAGKNGILSVSLLAGLLELTSIPNLGPCRALLFSPRLALFPGVSFIGHEELGTLAEIGVKSEGPLGERSYTHCWNVIFKLSHSRFFGTSLFSTCQELKIESPDPIFCDRDLHQQVLYYPGSTRFLGWAQAVQHSPNRPKEVESLQSRNAQMDVQNVIRRSTVGLHLTNSTVVSLWWSRHITDVIWKKLQDPIWPIFG